MGLVRFLVQGALLTLLGIYLFFGLVYLFTGIRIKRVGYLSIRWIQWISRSETCTVEIRKIGLRPQRPSITRRTWLGIVVSDATITIRPAPTEDWGTDEEETTVHSSKESKKEVSMDERIRRLGRMVGNIVRFRVLNWVDLEFSSTTLVVEGAGTFQMGMFFLGMNANPQMFKRERILSPTDTEEEYPKPPRNDQPLEITVTIRDLYFSINGKEFTEIAKTVVLTVDFELGGRYGVQSVKAALRIAGFSIPYDNLMTFKERIAEMKTARPGTPPRPRPSSPSTRPNLAFLDIFDEIQIHVTLLQISVEVSGVRPQGKPTLITLGLKDVGLDLIKLEKANVLNKLFNQRDLVEHQVLLTIISVAIDVNTDGRQGHGDQIFNLPLTTLAGKTCVLYRYIKGQDDTEGSSAVANIVITSPSTDLGPNHLQLILALLNHWNTRSKYFTPPQTPDVAPVVPDLPLITRFFRLPKIGINFSVHEPSFRMLVPSHLENRMLVWNISNLLFEIHGQYSPLDKIAYQIDSSFKFGVSHIHLWESDGRQLQILRSGSCEIKLLVPSIRQPHLESDVYLESLQIELNRSEIIDCVTRFIAASRFDLEPDRLTRPKKATGIKFDHLFPEWLQRIAVEGREIDFVVAGADTQLSDEVRGIAIQFQSWLFEYHRDYHVGHKHSVHGHKKLTFEARHFRVFGVESEAHWDRDDPIVDTPDIHVSVSHHVGQKQDEVHLTVMVPDCLVGFSLFKLYAVFLSVKTLQNMLRKPKRIENFEKRRRSSASSVESLEIPVQKQKQTILVIDARSDLLRVRINLPEEQNLLLETSDLHISRENYTGAIPYARASFVRLHVRSPIAPEAWDRMVSIRGFKIEYREEFRYIDTKKLVPSHFVIRTEAIRLRIPHQFKLFEVIESMKNSFKSSKQLAYRFTHDFAGDFILSPQAEDAKRLPRMRIKSKSLILDIEDDPFEARLGFLYRVGTAEQAARMAREVAFEAKVQALKASSPEASTKSTTSGPIPEEHDTAHAPDVDKPLKKEKSRRRLRKAEKPKPTADDEETVPTHERRKSMRYQPEMAVPASCEAEISIEAARNKLLEHNSQAWVRRFRWALDTRAKQLETIREQLWGDDELSPLLQSHEKILPLPSRPPLFSIQLSSVDVTLDRPSFGFDHLPEFLHKTGGLPLDTQFTTLIPFHIKWTMNEVRVLLRDYPLPFIHIPPVHHSQHHHASQRLYAWSLETDMVIAEEVCGEDAIFRCDTVVIPADLGRKGSPAFKISVPRTVSPVKFYSSLDVDINSSSPTRVVWGTSYQPALHDAMAVLDTFTKPQLDPSDKIGFWDKMRLIIHSHFKFNWKGGGDVHLTLKGSRNPYVIIGQGAGFIFCWRGDVVWKIATEETTKDLSHVDSDEFILAIPDFTREPIDTDDFTDHENAFSSTRVMPYSRTRNAIFRKVIMKLNGGVRWIAGLVFERKCPPTCTKCEGRGRCRLFNFIPHYDVHLKTPEYCHDTARGDEHDSYRGFRSDFMHGSLSIISPRDSSSKDGYNTVHLSPKAFAHFFSWWRLFSGVMSIPLRQGGLFPSVERPPKKFNRHLATLKYQLDLSPLYLAHTYRHKDSADYAKRTTTITGIKARLDRLTLDLHQRKEEKVIILKELQTKRRAMHMGINKTRVDFESTDFRALVATIPDMSPEELHELSHSRDAPEEVEGWGTKTIELVNDDDLDWIDKDDFVEVDVLLPKTEPVGRVWPLAYGSRFTYYRSTDATSETSMDKSGAADSISYQFGSEDSHHCLMDALEDPENVQYHLFEKRHSELVSILKKLEKEPPGAVQLELDVVRGKILFLDKLLRHSYLYTSDSWADAQALRELEKNQTRNGTASKDSRSPKKIVDDPLAGLGETIHFKNRFIVHNLQLKWHNDVRNVIFNYIHQISRRRGFIYYMSQRAIKFLSDVVKEQKSQQVLNDANANVNDEVNGSESATGAALDEVALLIQQLLDDKEEHFVVLDETQAKPSEDDRPGTAKRLASVDLSADLGEMYAVKNEYSVQLIAPQIQLQSQKNVDAAVIMSAESMYLQIFAVMDKESIDDEVGGLIQRRFTIGMDHAQFFVALKKTIEEFKHRSILSNIYGANSALWPPWIPVETVYDFNADPLLFTRMVERTSASMRYDKHNPLRLKLNDRVQDDIFRSSELSSLTPLDRRIDDISVHFPRIIVTADSAQYYALYLIVTDLLIYSEPLVKRQNVELDKIMLASDFSDMTGAPEMVKTLQERIRQLEEIDLHFRVNAHTLDQEGCNDQISLREELNSCEEELFFLMKAVTMAQEKHDGETETVPTMRWYLSAREVIWHMICDDNSPMVDLGLSNATYRRYDNSDSSNYNTMEIEMMQGINLLPNSLYTDVLGPYFGSNRTVVDAQRSKMIRVYWHMLESIGGIPIMDHFEVNLFPLMVKLEHDFGRRVFAYMFPEPKVSSSSSKRQRQDADDSETESELESQDHSLASSQVSLPSSVVKFPTRRPVSSSGQPTLKRMTSLHAIGEESSKAETQSIASKVSTGSDTTKRPSVPKDEKEKEKPKAAAGQADDLTQMLSRASQNITLIYVKVPSTVLCLSYKAPKGKSIEDVNDFVFTMPTIEYRNRTWSYVDLAVHLKKDVFKAILSHSGMLIRDKLTIHRKAKPPPNQIMRQLSSYRSYTHLNDLRTTDHGSTDISSSETASRQSTESLPSLRPSASTLSLSRRGSGYLSPLGGRHHDSDEEKSSGIFNNALTRHLREISHLSRHRDGIGDDNEESSVRKTKMLLGKFVGK